MNDLSVEKDHNQIITVSVIVITFNHSKFIAKALDSILMQKTNFSYEILIGDDASNDGTSDIVREYAEKYPEIIHAKIRNKNIGNTLNAYDILCSAKGKYLATCEGDDFWTDEFKLQRQVNFLENQPQYSGCVHPILFVDEDGIEIKHYKLPWISDKKEFSISDFDGCTLPGHVVSTVRRNYMKKTGFDIDFIYLANAKICDRTCAMLWLAEGNYYRLDKKMAAYRVIKNGNNATNELYKKNNRRYTDDYEYTIILERYANTRLNLSIRFDKHKRDLYAKAFISSLIDKDSDDKSLPGRIVKENGHLLWYFFGIFRFIIDRIELKITQLTK